MSIAVNAVADWLRLLSLSEWCCR